MNYVINLGVLLLLGVLVPFILIMTLRWLGNLNKKLTYRLCGMRGEIYIGSIGTIIHEGSHLIMAVIFHHHIEEAQFLHYDPEGQTLGKVSHSWNTRNFYESFGNLFIGIAPIFGNGIILVLLSKWLLNTKWTILLDHLTKGSLNFRVLANWVASLNINVLSWQFWVFIIISFSILCGGFDLSNADLENATTGLWGLLIILFLLAMGTTYFGVFSAVVNVVVYMLLIWGLLTIYVMILSLLTTIVMESLILLTKHT